VSNVSSLLTNLANTDSLIRRYVLAVEDTRGPIDRWHAKIPAPQGAGADADRLAPYLRCWL